MRLTFIACCALALLVATTSFVAAEETEKKADSWSWGGGKGKEDEKKAVEEEEGEDSPPGAVEGEAQGRSIGGFGPSAAAGGSFSSSSKFQTRPTLSSVPLMM
jgi:hypothetical protein